MLTALPSTGHLLCPFKVGVGAGLQGGSLVSPNPAMGSSPAEPPGPGR